MMLAVGMISEIDAIFPHIELHNLELRGEKPRGHQWLHPIHSETEEDEQREILFLSSNIV